MTSFNISGGTDKSPVIRWYRGTARRTAIRANATEMRLHANRLPVMPISLKAAIAAAVWMMTESARTMATAIEWSISKLSSSGASVSYFAQYVQSTG